VPEPIFDRVIKLAEGGSAHLTIEHDGSSFLALHGKTTLLGRGVHGDDLCNVVLLLTEGMTVRRRAKVDPVGEMELGID